MAKLRSQTALLTLAAVAGDISASTTAPTSPVVGQRWYKPETGVTYQYTSDGATSFWLDLSSQGISRSGNRTVTYAGDTDPLPNHNGGSASLAVGQVYFNREAERHFFCTDATNDANVWAGRFAGVGGIVTTYLKSSTYYRIHTFLSGGTMHFDSTISCDILMVGGGGGGGNCPTTGASPEYSGGGGAGGMLVKVSQSIAAGSYPIVVGYGGTNIGNSAGAGVLNETGGITTGFGFTSHGGGRGAHQGYNSAGGSQYTAVDGTASTSAYPGGGGASGGGAHGNGSNAGGNALHSTSNGSVIDAAGYWGNAGGAGGSPAQRAGGGGGAAGAGGSNLTTGGGGAGLNNTFRTNSNTQYCRGGNVAARTERTSNCGDGGNGGNEASDKNGKNGSSGIVVIRYALN